jgi:hypothetical protein
VESRIVALGFVALNLNPERTLMKAILDWVALVLLIIGGLNWLLVGLP